jgi:inositol transport system ATP-binding protein
MMPLFETKYIFVKTSIIPRILKNSDSTDYVLEMRDISKSFPGVVALDDVGLSVRRGEIHTLMGENGAGKSTLMKILAGVYLKDSGQIILKGKPVEIRNELHALQLGIAMVHQELNNFPDMTVAENIFAGREPSAFGILNRAKMNTMARKVLSDFRLTTDPDKPMRELSISEMQLVEIAKAVSCKADLLIMDEPTSAISSNDARFLFGVLERLKESGVSVIYISHKMDEVFRISDRITVLRDGKWISTNRADKITWGGLITSMVGRELKELYPQRSNTIGEPVLQVEKLSRGEAFADISFTIRRGEILGFAGLVGSGRTEILESVFGFIPADTGEILVSGERAEIKSPFDAIGFGIALVPEDRKLSGLNLEASVLFNITLPTLSKLFSKMGIINRKSETSAADNIIHMLRIKAQSLSQGVGNLSGGNQQKIVIAKWLLSQPAILLLDEPTRGIDIGAKSEIYRLMNELVAQGISILMVSSEMTELIGMCDRILTIRKGCLSGEFNQTQFNQEHILTAIMP